jgi:hypothetical protein
MRRLGVLLLVLSAAIASSAGESGLPLSGAAAEEFLREAEVVAMKPIGVGITKPMKVTLRRNGREHHAVWKTVDDLRQGIFQGPKGGFQSAFRDSYKYEVAAYELDKLLQLGLVPPTVSREIDGRRGSLQLWVENAFTELDRRESDRLPQDYVSWSNELYKLRLLHQLTFNDDARNVRNVVYDESFQPYAIDNSRSFRRYHYLSDESGLLRFSRGLLARLAGLDRARLERALDPWLDSAEIEAILARRDLLLQTASEKTQQYGEAAVLYP